MATCRLSQTGAIFVLLAISKPCIRFRWSLYRFRSKSTHLYSGTLGFPSWGQVQSSLCKSCICIASRIPHIIPCSYVGCLLCRVLLSGVCFFGLVPVTSRLWGPVWLRSFVFFMDSFFFLAGFQARWPYPRNHFYLCLLSCSLFCYAYDAIPTTCLSCHPYCWTKPLTHLVLANCCLAMLPLCSAPLIALLVAGEDKVCSLLEHDDVVPCWNMFTCWDITIYLI